MKSLINRQRGFTLIELLVVIVVIGILVALTLPNLFSAQERARDTERKSDARNLSLLLETYWNDNQSYPVDLADITNYEADDFAEDVRDGYEPLLDDGNECTGAETCVAYTITVELENADDPDTGDDDSNYVVNSINRPSGVVAE